MDGSVSYLRPKVLNPERFESMGLSSSEHSGKKPFMIVSSTSALDKSEVIVVEITLLPLPNTVSF